MNRQEKYDLLEQELAKLIPNIEEDEEVGFTSQQLSDLWGTSGRTTMKRIRDLIEEGVLEVFYGRRFDLAGRLSRRIMYRLKEK